MPTSDGRDRWLLSTKHLVGAALALGGPALAIAGVVSAPIGLALALPLYAIGALLAPSRSIVRPTVGSSVADTEVTKQLDRLQSSVKGRVPTAVQQRVEHIATTIRETLPRADELGPGSRQAHTVVQTATDYLPDALDAYLKLPRSYADAHVVADGKTPLQLLTDQLDLLAKEMDEVFDAVCRADADALVAHGRFLDDKFARGSLDLGTPSSGPTSGSGPARASGPKPPAAGPPGELPR